MCETNDESCKIAVRYRTIKKRLDSLGYRQALSLEALPLTEKLLADLIQTTESLKHFKAIAENNIESCEQPSLSIDPYNYGNTKLVEECNELHSQLLEIKESNLIQTKDLKRKIQRLENECNDLQLASSVNLKKIKDLELESSNKSKRIQELLGKCCKPTINNVNSASKKRLVYPLRRPVIESELAPKGNVKSETQLPNLTKVNPQVIDLVRMADRKISSLSHEVTKLKDELSIQTDNVGTLKTQLTMKEKEINRLKKLHDGGRSYTVTMNECSCRKNEPNCGQCNFTNRRIAGNYSQSVCNKVADISEIKVLQQAKLNLEQQLRDALDKQHDAMSQAMKLAERNEELEKELRDIDHVALAVEADCNSTMKHNNKRVSQLQEKLEDAMTNIRELENSLLGEKRTSQELRADLEGCKLEKRNIQRALENALDEKKHLTNRINELTIIENGLNAEIDRMVKRNEIQKHEIVELEFVNNSLKKQLHESNLERNREKGEERLSVDKNQMRNNDVAASSDRRHSLTSPNHINSNNNRDNNEKLVECGTNKKLKKKMDESQKLIEELECDRDHYKDQWYKLNEKINKSSDTENAELWSQICDLKHQLNEKEARISELQREKRELCREKFDLENRSQIPKSNTRPCNYCNVCRSMNACECPSGGSEIFNSSKLTLTRLEHERDTARAEVERLTKERDILHERLKLATEAHTGEQRRLRNRLRDVEAKLEEIASEKQDILITQESRQSALSGLEDQLDDLKSELRTTKQELTSQRTQYFQLRALQDQTDQALGDVQSQLIQSETELSKALDRNKNLDQQQLQMDNQIMELKQEINTLRANMARLDREKDQLLMNLDEKTERIAVLEREVMIKEQQTMGVDHQLRDLQHKNQICLDQCAEQERQLRNMQMEIDNYQRQLAAAAADRELATQENKQLQNDLAAVTYDSRTLQRELETSRAESHDLKKQLQTYVSEVRRAEELINRKENERTEMLNHFRSLSLEASVLENNNHSLESEAAEAKSALQSMKDRVLDLEGQLADKECHIRRYEVQIKELTQNVASLETHVRQQKELRDRTESDLYALRDLCVKLDKEKELLKRDIEKCCAVKAQYKDELEKLKMDHNAVHNQRSRDHAMVDSLEKLLNQETMKSMEYHRLNQELQNKIERLEERIAELQSKLSAESAELKSYQNQVAEYSKQIAELRRHLTDERFNRARKDEEHRSKVSLKSNYGELVYGPAPIVTFDSINFTRQPSHGSLRHNEEPLACKESTRFHDPMIEAEETNRFDKEIELHKDTHSQNNEHTFVFAHGPGIGEPSHSRLSMPGGSGPICVKATVEEDENHKDIRLRIIEQPSISQRQLRPETRNMCSNTRNCERKDTTESSTSTEIHEHNVKLISIVENAEKIDDRQVTAQIKNEPIYKLGTNQEQGHEILEKSPSNLRNKVSKTHISDVVQVVDDENTHQSEKNKRAMKEGKKIETQIPKVQKIDECGCDNNDLLPDCVAFEQNPKHRIAFKLNDNDINSSNNDDHDEGYYTTRFPVSPEHITTERTPNKHLSMEKLNVPKKIIVKDDHSPGRNITVPVLITQPNTTPIQVNLENGEIEIPIAELSQQDVSRQLTEIKEMANELQKHMTIVNDLQSKNRSNYQNHDRNQQQNTAHLEVNDINEFRPMQVSTPDKPSFVNKNIKQQSPTKQLNTKLNRSIIEYSDKTKLDYPSDDENGERCKISRSRTLVIKSKYPNDRHEASTSAKDTKEKTSSNLDSKSKKIEVKEKSSRSELQRAKTQYDKNDVRSTSDREKPRECEYRKCWKSEHCPTKYRSLLPTRLTQSPHRMVNVETQSIETHTATGKLNSHSFNQSPSRGEPSIGSKVREIILSGPAKHFMRQSSHEKSTDRSNSRNTKFKSAATSRDPPEQHRPRSRPINRECFSQQTESSSKKPASAPCAFDT